MGLKRRVFLFGTAALAGGGMFGLWWRDSVNLRRAVALTTKAGESSFAGWLKIAADDAITLYVPHVDMGQGVHTSLAQMCVDELDGDWGKVSVELAPADLAFANGPLVKAFVGLDGSIPGILTGPSDALFSQAARFAKLQITGGSTALRMTGQYGMRVIGAAAREALVATACEIWDVPAAQVSVANSVIRHAASARSLRFGELAAQAAARSMNHQPRLKTPDQYTLMGTSPARLDIPDKVTGRTIYGIDVQLPNMRVATIQTAPVFGQELGTINEAAALAVAGVEKVIRLPNAAVVVAKGYWTAKKGLDALAANFVNSANAKLGINSTEALYMAQDHVLQGKLSEAFAVGDVTKAMQGDVKVIKATYRVPFLHHASMEPISLTAHFQGGILSVWGSIQDPLSAKYAVAEAAGLDADNVRFFATPIGGSFGRRFPGSAPQLQQIAIIAKHLSHPVKLIWSREEDFTHGGYRPQLTCVLEAGLQGKNLLVWDERCNADQNPSLPGNVFYQIPAKRLRYADCAHRFPTGAWRAVEHTQHGFWTESFIDEIAHAAGADPLAFRHDLLAPDSRYRKVLNVLAEKANWSKPLPNGRARGLAMIEAMGSIAGQVIEVSFDANQQLRVDRVVAVVDCGFVVHPNNAIQQVQGGILMGLSAALSEQITMKDGAVQQLNFPDYPILLMQQTPKLEVHFLNTGAAIGGLGEPGLPPVAPALANAVFALTGHRVRKLPLLPELARLMA